MAGTASRNGLIGVRAGVTEPLLLSDLEDGGPGLRRVVHGYGTAGTWRRTFARYGTVLREILTALPRDLAVRTGKRSERIVRIDAGADPSPDATSLALYVHYAPSGQVSEMVRCQLRALRQAGFAVVFISCAAKIPDADWRAVGQICALSIQRRNFGLDFGAWHDAVPEVRRRWPNLSELMLANDSVLGPIHPMQPVFDALRSGGEGLFGLTESLQGGPHLQSYMLLAKGRPAVVDMAGFLEGLALSHSKWLLVQRGELRLARWMRGRGHRVAALYGYDRLVRAVLADPVERAWLADKSIAAGNIQLLRDWPVNPTQHLWHGLVACLGAPFIKTELIRRNPARLAGVASWPDLVPQDAPCGVVVLQAHLKMMRAE